MSKRTIYPLLNKRLNFAINYYPINELLPIAKRVCGTDYAVSFYNNKNHPGFYHNEETFRKALRRCVAINAFDHKEQIIEALNLREVAPIEKLQDDLLYAKKPFKKEDWDTFYYDLIDKTINHIKQFVSSQMLTMDDFKINKKNKKSDNETYICYKSENIDDYIQILFQEESNGYLINVFCIANGFNDIAVSEEPLIRFIWDTFPIFSAAESIENGPERDILVDNGLYLSKKWNLKLDIESIVSIIRKRMKKKDLKDIIFANPNFGSDPGSYTKSDLKALGFTDVLIRNFLPEPRQKINPHYKSGAPMLLWWKDDVDKVIASSLFKEAYSQTLKRRESCEKTVKKKKDTTLKEIDKQIAKIKIPLYPIDILYENSLNARIRFLENEAAMRMDGGMEILDSALSAPYADIDTRKRWAVNYIRHELTDYDLLLEKIKGKVGVGEAYTKYKNAIMDAIFEAYPDLKS